MGYTSEVLTPGIFPSFPQFGANISILGNILGGSSSFHISHFSALYAASILRSKEGRDNF